MLPKPARRSTRTTHSSSTEKMTSTAPSTAVATATRHSARLTVAASVSPASSPRLSPRLARRPAVPAVVKVGDGQEPRAPPPPPQLSSSSREGATPAGVQFDTEALQQALRTKMSAASATPVTPFFRKKQHDRNARPCSVKRKMAVDPAALAMPPQPVKRARSKQKAKMAPSTSTIAVKPAR